ncbi:MAG TPA: hypothetical protein PLR74_12945 [Agriterribacter sp.]|nr:hypothetical protein [Agriterribacter sp.]
MKKLIPVFAIAALLILSTSSDANAQSEKPYKEGTVWHIELIKTKSGMGQMYLKDLATHWVKMAKAAQSRGYIMDYKVLSAEPGFPGDWDLMLLMEVKNYAALDDVDDKMNALAKELFGSEDTQHQSAISRNDMRERLGGKLAQELIFK